MQVFCFPLIPALLVVVLHFGVRVVWEGEPRIYCPFVFFYARFVCEFLCLTQLDMNNIFPIQKEKKNYHPFFNLVPKLCKYDKLSYIKSVNLVAFIKMLGTKLTIFYIL